MQIDPTRSVPIFQQVAEGIEDAILMGIFAEGEQVPSTTEISTRFTINPATALKGINLLVQEGLIYKKRGLGMFVAADARRMIRDKRQLAFRADFLNPLFTEARRLKLEADELSQLFMSELARYHLPLSGEKRSIEDSAQ